MSSKIVIAILAHNAPECLADLVENARHFIDPEEIVLYNGGSDARLGVDLDIAVVPDPVRLMHGNLIPFHAQTMRFLGGRGLEYDYLVTLDSDMLFIRPGFGGFLDSTMENSGFMAAGYLRSDPWCESRMPRLRRFNSSWRHYWGPIMGSEVASWAYNPGMVFRHSTVDAICGFAKLDRLVAIGRRSRLHGIEEFVYPSLVDALGCSPIRQPEESGNHPEVVDVDTLHAYLRTPTCFLIHKVALEQSDPVRLEVTRLRSGQAASLDDPYERPVGSSPGLPPRPLAEAWPTAGVREHLKDLYFRVLP